MMRFVLGFLVIGIGVAAFVVWSEQAATDWQVKSSLDPMTDQRLTVASRLQRPAGRELYWYELVLTCGASGRKAEVRTFQNDGTDDILNPRLVPLNRTVNWTTASNPDAGVFGFRVDDTAAQEGAFIAPDYPNVLLIDAVFPEPQDEMESLSQAVLHSALDLGKILDREMPARRLVVSGVFPNEAVEFRFDDMAPGDRNLLAAHCWAAQ